MDNLRTCEDWTKKQKKGRRALISTFLFCVFLTSK
jgi:hypothetical protein